ncbi:MAG: RNA polymerase sigma factor [Chitinophagaceae bacterium]
MNDMIIGCIKGNRGCQADLYERYSPKMMIVCLRYSKNLEEAEEILQDGFIRVFKFIGQFKNEGSFEGWIRKIMVNCALQKFRSQVNLRPILSLNTEAHEVFYEENIIENINGKEMIQMVQSLSPAYRMVFNLFYFEGYKHREIAALLGIEEGTSKSNLAQAKKILQTVFKKYVRFEKIVLNG